MTEMAADLNLILEEGWIPKAMSVTDYGIYLLIIETVITVGEWGIAESGDEISEIQVILDRYQSAGYQLMDFSSWNAEQYYLYLNLGRQLGRSIRFGAVSCWRSRINP
jgi:hypothetical protein